MLLGLVPAVGLACFGIFLALFSFSRIVSLASLGAAFSLPLLMLAAGAPPAYLALGLLAGLLVIWRHRTNLQRLLAGTEPRIGSKS
jgi:glycerol-3-phosphate acyltransferase PlsY